MDVTTKLGEIVSCELKGDVKPDNQIEGSSIVQVEPQVASANLDVDSFGPYKND